MVVGGSTCSFVTKYIVKKLYAMILKDQSKEPNSTLKVIETKVPFTIQYYFILFMLTYSEISLVNKIVYFEGLYFCR